jgi:hypothetical protein
MLTAEQRARFDELGHLRFTAFSAEDAVAMQAAVWDELSRVHGIRPDDTGSWRAGPTFGLRRIREEPTFAPIGGPPMRAAIDGLLGAGTWDAPKRWGAFLVTFPHPGTWVVPHHIWHADFAFDLPAEPMPGVKVFVFVSDVPPRTGGTLVVEGSHRVVRRALDALPPAMRADTRRTRLRILASDPWLRALSSPSGSNGCLEPSATADGTPVRVVELTGRAGEVVLTHPWLLHSPAPNCGVAARFMRSTDVYRREQHPDPARRNGLHSGHAAC